MHIVPAPTLILIMTIPQQQLRAAGSQSTIRRSAPSPGQKTAFLCHSHHDQQLAIGLQELLRAHGMDLYIDWQDPSMPSQPSAESAARLRRRIQMCDLFLFLATQNSMNSRWCPWELGHADGTKKNDRILLVPTYDGSSTHGSEYLNLYQRVDIASDGKLAAFGAGTTQGTYVRFL